MPDFTLQIPSKVVLGIDSLSRVGSLIKPLCSRVILVTEEILNEWSHVDRLKNHLEKAGINCMTYGGAASQTTSQAVSEAVSLAAKAKAQAVIGLGGVRTLSIAKCTAALALKGGDIDRSLDGEPFPVNGLAYVEIPTTCRNPFMLNDSCIVVDARNRNTKMLRTGIYANAVIIDPALSLSLSAKLTATTMLDAFLSALEGIISLKANFVSDSLLYRAFSYIVTNIKRAMTDLNNLETRYAACQAGLLTAMGLSTSMQGVGSAIAYTVSGKLKIPQSAVSAVLIPHIMDWAVRVCPEKIAALADAIGETTAGRTLDTAQYLVSFMRHLIASLGLPLRLSDFGVKSEELAGLPEIVRLFEGVSYAPVPLSEEDIFGFLKNAY